MVVAPGQRVTDEEVAAAKPDIIVLAWAATGNKAKAASALRNSTWQNVPAVKNRHVFVIRDELLNTPGPPLMKGAAELLRIIHTALGERF
jgi:ABC-type Fe3+-hydroxamate transport system substrate-binding protein